MSPPIDERDRNLLGEVGPHQTRTFVLPHTNVGAIFAETEGGRRLDQQGRANPVRIRRGAAEQGR